MKNKTLGSLLLLVLLALMPFAGHAQSRTELRNYLEQTIKEHQADSLFEKDNFFTKFAVNMSGNQLNLSFTFDDTDEPDFARILIPMFNLREFQTEMLQPFVAKSPYPDLSVDEFFKKADLIYNFIITRTSNGQQTVITYNPHITDAQYEQEDMANRLTFINELVKMMNEHSDEKDVTFTMSGKDLVIEIVMDESNQVIQEIAAAAKDPQTNLALAADFLGEFNDEDDFLSRILVYGKCGIQIIFKNKNGAKAAIHATNDDIAQLFNEKEKPANPEK